MSQFLAPHVVRGLANFLDRCFAIAALPPVAPERARSTAMPGVPPRSERRARASIARVSSSKTATAGGVGRLSLPVALAVDGRIRLTKSQRSYGANQVRCRACGGLRARRSRMGGASKQPSQLSAFNAKSGILDFMTADRLVETRAGQRTTSAHYGLGSSN
jgi:hypothetical protein